MDLSDILGNKESEDKIAYSTGVVMAQSLQDIGFNEMDFDDFLKGFKAKFKNEILKIPQKKNIEIFNNYVEIIKEEQKERNLEISKQFLKENSEKGNVVTLKSGLQYKVLVQGEGELPQLEDKVKVLYEGYLMNRNVFDTTKDTGPLSFYLSQTILGWQEVLLLMPIGSRWEITIPPHLAYGENGAAPMIEPNAAIVYIIELLEIEKE
ncbi:MAG: FKBP-type peptidyl-prolyl cis-trans isomerase [Flavobacteriales bacterium]